MRTWGSRTPPLMCLVAGLTLLAGCVGPEDAGEGAQVTPQASADYLHVEVIDDLVTVQASHVPLHDLLLEIGRQSGLVVLVHGRLDERITLELHQLPLPEAIGRILGDQSFALHYAGPSSSPEDSSDARPGKLWVFSQGSGDVHASSDITSAIDVLRMESMNADARRRQDAVEALGALEVDEAIGPLTLALADNDANVRLEAVAALAHLGSDQAVAALAAAVGDIDPSVREEAVDALGDVGGENAIQALGQALMDPDNEVREAAIEALVHIGGEESARALAVTLSDENPSLREEAVDALGEIGGDTAITLLEQALADEQSHIREAAAETLAELSGQEQ